MLLLFRAYYSKEDLALLFYPLLSKNTDFKSFVMSNFRSVTSVAEFAKKYNCSISTFNRRFKIFFGENAFAWINRHRVEHIKEDLENTSTPFATLAHRYGFSSQAYFSAFCKKQFSLTPKQIRKKE
ncbi:MAG: helix-turn-helix transcriptional regulator [Flavobacteriales bacterium]|nr:helix-turn-helix transcriptional regulator [Flavobacteriales bacterium]